jgi:hypothetical protein
MTAKCEYCGLYGDLGRCDGCGAPNKPQLVTWYDTNAIEVTTHGDLERKFLPVAYSTCSIGAPPARWPDVYRK